MIGNGNMTEWSPIRSVITRVITKLDDLFITSMIGRHEDQIEDQIGRHEVLLPINHKITISEKWRIAKLWKKRKLNIFKLQLWMWLVDLNYNFECDWLIELSDNKLSDNKLSDNKLSKNKLSNNNLASEYSGK